MYIFLTFVFLGAQAMIYMILWKGKEGMDTLAFSNAKNILGQSLPLKFFQIFQNPSESFKIFWNVWSPFKSLEIHCSV